MPLKVAISARAAAQVRRAAQWWSAHRPAAPDAIATDLRGALILLAEQPGIGARCLGSRTPEVRRLYLSRIRYFVYYRVSANTLQVLALWHESRQGQPTV